jgi:hypothetical protein
MRGQLGHERLATEAHDELGLRPLHPGEPLGGVHGQPDRTALLGERAGDRLADPPRRVRGEPEAAPVVELLDRADEPDRAFLDEVQKREPATLVVAGDGDDEAQVALDHAPLGLEVAALHAARELEVLAVRQQPPRAYVAEEQVEAVGRL